MKDNRKLFDAQNVTNGSLDYFIFSPIGIDPDTGEGISGQRFANDLDWIQNCMKDEVKTINVRINSGGGSIVEGLSMLSAIRNCSIPVDTYVEGIAASMAGVVAMSGRKRFMNDYSRIMIHDPSIDESNDLSEQDKQTLANFKDVLKNIFTNNSHYTTEQIDSIMSAETWLNAIDAKAAGLIDSIIKTERNLGVFANDSKTVYSFANDLFKLKTIASHKNTFNMKKIHAKFTELKLFKNNEGETENDKIENAVIETVESLKSENETLKQQLADKDAELATAKTELDSAKGVAADATDAAATTAVDGAVNDGKIDIAKRDEMLAIAKKDLPAFNTMIGAMKKTAVKVTNVIRDNAGKEISENDGMINGQTLRQLEKSNPTLVEKIKNEQPEVFEKLYVKQYGVKPSSK